MRVFLVILWTALTFAAASCAQRATQKDPKFPPGVQLLAFEGYNLQPHWVTENELLYHSSQRERHEGSQIYRHVLGTRESKRITYHDGATESAHHLGGGVLLYTSTTDEDKELSKLVERLSRASSETAQTLLPGLTLLPTEIYRSALDGTSIRRLSTHSGFDGRLHYNPETQRVLYSSLRKGLLQIFSMSTGGSQVRQLTSGKGHSVEVQYAPDQSRYYWIEVDESLQRSRLMWANHRFRNPQPLSLPEGLYASLDYVSEQGILLSAQLEDSLGLDLFFYRLQDLCLLPLLRAAGDQISPRLSPDGSQLAFVHQSEGQSQIALMSFSPPEACPLPPSTE